MRKMSVIVGEPILNYQIKVVILKIWKRRGTNKHFQTLLFIFAQPHPEDARTGGGRGRFLDALRRGWSKGVSHVGSLFSNALRETP